MKRSKQAKKAALKSLEDASKSEQQLVDELAVEDIPRKYVVRALEKLTSKGKIVLSDGCYSLIDTVGHEQAPEQMVPFAQILRQRDEIGAKQRKPSTVKEQVDIDAEIRRLEEELAADEESDYEWDDADEEETNSVERHKRVSFGPAQVKEIESIQPSKSDATRDSVLCLSTVAQERIDPLPEAMLPKIKKRPPHDVSKHEAKKSKVSNGLSDAVKEVLSGYVARSSERLPFYCRVCAKQFTNEKDFFQHKSSDFHKTAVEVERKASYCKLCRKQFTSPVQLKEHISSRPHKERLHHVQQRQGRASGHRDVGGDRSRRQWC